MGPRPARCTQSAGSPKDVKLSLMQENLARGLSIAGRAVSSPTRTALPVLGNVLLRTEDAGLKLTATNLEIGITTWVPGRIDAEGAITVPARLIADVVSSLPSDERVELEVEDGTTLRLKAGRYQTHIRGTDADEYPVITPAGDRPTTRIRQGDMRRALSEVVFAAANDEARPILTGVLTRLSGDEMVLAAADNYRIAVKRVPLQQSTEETTLVVPARSYAEVSRLLGDSDDSLDLMLAQARSQVVFRVEGIEFVSRLIDGQFPNYESVLPSSHTTRALVDREDLLQAVRLSALMAAPNSNVIRLDFGEGSTGLTVAASGDAGDAKGEVEAEIEGDGVSIAFNSRYLVEALQNVAGERLGLEFSGPLSPGVIKPVDDPAYVHVIMPVRTPS